MQDIAGNRYLAQLINDARKVIKLTRRDSLRLEGRLKQSLAEHRDILDALRDKDPARAQRSMHDHLRSGRNALDAMIALFVSVGLWRQQLPTHCRVHGIIQEGGTAANIIPDRTRAWFMIRSADQAFYDDVMKPRFTELCEAAAKAAGVEVEVEYSGYASTMKHNHVLADRWNANAAVYGIGDNPTDETSGSTDMANVSWHVPAIHPSLSITEMPTPGHSIEFRDAAARPLADEVVLLAATLVAQTALDVLLDPATKDAAWSEFRGGKASA